MTDDNSAAQDLDDARLLDLVRAGDDAAYEVLYDRHEQAARRLVRDLVVSPAEIDDVVAETFGRILAVMERGGGPTDAFRPYVLTAVRRVCHDRLQAQRRQFPTAEVTRADPGDPFVDAAVASLSRSLIAQAFMSLPERWSAALWHTAIENASAAEAGPIFGLTDNGLAALRQRAKDGLCHAYLQMYMANVTRPACKPVAQRLGGFLRQILTRREAAFVAGHLTECRDCEAVYAELTDIDSALRGVVAPIFLGSAAASYVASAVPAAADEAGGFASANSGSGSSGLGLLGLAPRPSLASAGPPPAAAASRVAGAAGPTTAAVAAASLRAAADVGAGGAADVGAGGAAAGAVGGAGAGAVGGAGAARGAIIAGQSAGYARLPRAGAPLRWLAAGAASIVAVFAIALAVTLTGNKTPAGPGHHHPLAAAAVSPLAVSSSAQSSTQPKHSLSPSKSPSASTSTGTSSSRPSTGPQPGVSNTPPPSPTPPASPQLSASIDFGVSYQSGQFQEVDFQVTDTGSGATGALTATITLPAGASMISGGDHAASDHGHGWSCQATSTGATCVHAAIGAGAQTGGAIFITVGTSACGQPVDVTAASGSVSASAKSGGIACGQGN